MPGKWRLRQLPDATMVAQGKRTQAMDSECIVSL